MIKAIIFDLDGTLADTIGDLQVAMNRMLEHYGYRTVDRDGVLAAINRGARRFVAGCLPEGTFQTVEDDAVSEALAVYSGFYRESYTVNTHPYVGIPEALDRFKSSGMRLAVLSNKTHAMVEKIIATLFPDVFEVVMGPLEFPEKPDPRSALHIAETLGVRPDECAFVGDSNIDIETAINAGMHPIGVLWGYRSREVLAEAGCRNFAENADGLDALIRSL